MAGVVTDVLLEHCSTLDLETGDRGLVSYLVGFNYPFCILRRITGYVDNNVRMKYCIRYNKRVLFPWGLQI